jgi:8-oxo-dGTP diphosphatase
MFYKGKPSFPKEKKTSCKKTVFYSTFSFRSTVSTLIVPHISSIFFFMKRVIVLLTRISKIIRWISYCKKHNKQIYDIVIITVFNILILCFITHFLDVNLKINILFLLPTNTEIFISKMSNETIYNPHVSVDCVIFGFDGEKLKILLIERNITDQNEPYNDKKLPGSIILTNEDLDEAATRVLSELTGLKNIYLSQFKSFGNPNRTKNPRDIFWLENTLQLKIGRIVTVAYVALVKIDRKIQVKKDNTQACWFDVKDIADMNLAFDHAEIIDKGLEHIRHRMDIEPHLIFELLPRKFTITQLQTLYDTVHQTHSDVRNFRKKVAQWSYVVPLNELEEGVPHRAARLYKYKK